MYVLLVLEVVAGRKLELDGLGGGGREALNKEIVR